MDDRNIVAANPTHLNEHRVAWQSWSQTVGLLENETKTQVAVTRPRCWIPIDLERSALQTVRILGSFTANAKQKVQLG